jgi:hypothetical protein
MHERSAEIQRRNNERKEEQLTRFIKKINLKHSNYFQRMKEYYKEMEEKSRIFKMHNTKKQKQHKYLFKSIEEARKRKIDDCKRHKAMFGLEYAALIADIVLGFICTLLGLIHYLEQGKSFETISGLVGIASGVIATVLTIIYIIYSGIIFSNEYIRITNNNMPNVFYDNHAYLHWNGNKYVHNYDEQKFEKDLDVQYIKYKDLGKKQYNYDSEIYQMSVDQNSEYSHCKDDSGSSLTSQKPYTVGGSIKNCEYIWYTSLNDSVKAKYLYDRWLTSIIFSVLICVCGIGLALFGFLLFKGNSGSS